ncbi:MAG TPA: DUF6788 family protein [Pseudonocardiaceae bacterium]|nr:DUF6788 family protein [Pseudonocardiaceae bacterium]
MARDRWTALTVRVTATAATLTVFLEASGDAGERGATESVWFDDVALLAVQPFCPPETEPPRWIRSWWRGWRRRPARRACRCGSVAERRTTCGAANCRCRTDPTQRHGPYFEYTRKVAGKTTGRRLTAEQAEQYRSWIANRRTLDQITAAMDELSHQAVRLLTSPPLTALRAAEGEAPNQLSEVRNVRLNALMAAISSGVARPAVSSITETRYCI